MIVGQTMWTQSTSVTDKQTDGRTDGQTDRITITKTVQHRASHGEKQLEIIINLGLWAFSITIYNYGYDETESYLITRRGY